ncbi:MAG: cytochrome c3 family protein [Acidobacteriota bacterium]
MKNIGFFAISMRLKLLVTAVFISAAVTVSAPDSSNSLIFAQKFSNCIECHRDLGGELSAPVDAIKKDIHFQYGLSCADCHGGNPDIKTDDYEVAMDKNKGFKGKPAPQEIPEFCGKCHASASYMKKFDPNLQTDQLEQYRTSQHGLLLGKGDRKVATCISCHGVHGIVGAKDPLSPVFPSNIVETCGKCHSSKEYMAGYSIPTDQYEKYRKSVHGRALYEKGDISAPTCNDCHGNHGPMPPGVESIGNICGHCHLANWEMFIKSPHKEAYDATNIPECEICHGNHEILTPDDEMVGTSGKSLCITCHSPESKGYRAAGDIRNLIDSLKNSVSEAEAVVKKAASSGMEVGDAMFSIDEAEHQLTHARALVHTFSVEKIEKSIDEGVSSAQKGLKGGREALAELQFRRKGLAISLFFIAIVAVILYLKIRHRSKVQSASS